MFETLAASSGPSSAENIAEITVIDYTLTQRLLRFYQSFRWIKQVCENYNTVLNPGFAALPQYLKSKNYRNPMSVLDSAWQAGFNTNEYPFEVGQDMTDDTVLFVDIGSGLGSQSLLVKERFPHLKGWIIIQDQRHVIDAWGALSKPGVEAQIYDFFTPQPVKGARAYYMRNIIHDHQDSQAQEILENITSTFDQNSLMLIDDIVMPDSGGVPWHVTMADFNMMTGLAAKERTEKEWLALLESSGLKLIKIWKHAAETGDSIIVAKPKKLA
ncbi:S-adenosyl-L-methionine-dependent methyltransferase [Corynespora cassiicola Philippines]|uniref:S-adenosyl-L-methionine-dependent methyltransferase n=1 Tax=Corynespora cassiicola Philippines TaxID=1448308 RepID=A0A2T2NWR0_CORCC|nr:S-adenosyl-L-methionine-dependent methyltransferase [Corynespora cassiicola Philippines]